MEAVAVAVAALLACLAGSRMVSVTCMTARPALMSGTKMPAVLPLPSRR